MTSTLFNSFQPIMTYRLNCALPLLLIAVCTATLSAVQPTSTYLLENEVLTYSGSAPNLLFVGANAGVVTLKTVRTKSSELTNEKGNWQILLDLDLSRKIRWAYNYDAAIISQIDQEVFRFLVYAKADGKPGKRRSEKAKASYTDKVITYQAVHPDKTVTNQKVAIKDDALVDALSLIYYLRTISYPYPSGTTPPFKIFNRGKVTEVSLEYSHVQHRQHRKKIPVIHIKPSEATRGTIIRNRDVELFLDPKTKIPLRITVLGIPVIGKLVLELKKSNHPDLPLE